MRLFAHWGNYLAKEILFPLLPRHWTISRPLRAGFRPFSRSESLHHPFRAEMTPLFPRQFCLWQTPRGISALFSLQFPPPPIPRRHNTPFPARNQAVTFSELDSERIPAPPHHSGTKQAERAFRQSSRSLL